MEPATIATAAVTILAPFVKDVGRKLVETVGEVGVKKAEQLLGWLKSRFAGEPAAEQDLARFEKDPDKFEAGLQATIETKVESDPAFATELKRRVDEIGPQIVVFQQIKEGRNITGIEAEQFRSGNANVTQHADKVDTMTGVRAKNIG